jgi:hypothetical protein
MWRLSLAENGQFIAMHLETDIFPLKSRQLNQDQESVLGLDHVRHGPEPGEFACAVEKRGWAGRILDKALHFFFQIFHLKPGIPGKKLCHTSPVFTSFRKLENAAVPHKSGGTVLK